MTLYAFAVLCLGSLPLSWLLHGFDGVGGAWGAPLASLLLVALARWAARFRREAERRLREGDATLGKIASAHADGESTSG